MRIAICEDCVKDAALLKRFLGGHEASVYFNAYSLLTDVKDKNIKFDLYLLDIFMGNATEGSAMEGNAMEDNAMDGSAMEGNAMDGSAMEDNAMEGSAMDGIELGKRIREVQDEAVICFVSTSNDFYREAYDLYAVQYLLKPVQEAEIKKLLAKVAKSIAVNREQKLSVSSRGQVVSIPYAKILYISSREHTLTIRCTDGTVQECKGKLNELAMQVCGDTFIRCHQSFIVNMNYVDNLSGTDLIIAGELIPVSRRYYVEVKRRYQEMLFWGVD